jgi:hypothetical protein
MDQYQRTADLGAAAGAGHLGVRGGDEQRDAAHHDHYPAMTMIRTLILFLSLAAQPLLAQVPFSLSPASGPRSGGTTVIIRGTFIPGSHQVFFGGVPATSVTLLDEHTLSAVTPAHFDDEVDVMIIFGRGERVPATLTFAYTGPPPLAQYERLLLPVFVPPVQGLFGSLFVTTFSPSSKFGAVIPLFGLQGDEAVFVGQHGPAVDVAKNGTPGRFVYVPKQELRLFSANLRATDTSRSAGSFGTELPIVRESDFAEDVIVLNDVPTDARFRNTLRVYSPYETMVFLEIGNRPGEVRIDLRKNDPEDPFEPAYGVFTDFPVGAGPVRLTITANTARGISPPIYLGPIWAFVSVTNNETQHITTITPQP